MLKTISFIFLLYLNTIVLLGQYKYGEDLPKNTIKALNSKNNYLYVGIDNPLSISLGSMRLKGTLLLKSSNGKIFYDEDTYYIFPERSGKARIVFYDLSAGDTTVLGYKILQVFNVPEPKLLVDTLKLTDKSTVSKVSLIGSNDLNIYVSDDIIGSENWYKIEKIYFGYIYGGFYVSKTCESNVLTNEFKRIVSQLGPGKELSIKLYVKTQGEMTMELPVYRLTVY